MRVLQLIDSLHPGGAERLATGLANSLVSKIEGSYLCATREEGLLKETVSPEVGYLFLEKSHTIDLKALKRLKKYCKSESITHVHAHGTSFFTASLIRIMLPSLKLIWHDHLGSRSTASVKSQKGLKWASRYFNQIITVNSELKHWSEKHLHCNKVSYIPNFIDTSHFRSDKKRENTMACVANLKEPKNHLHLIKAYRPIAEKYPEWTLKLIGNHFDDAYYKSVVSYIDSNQLGEYVILEGSATNVYEELSTAKIGVLASTSEGLPMSLLEYGAAGLAVVTTDVGYCKEVISTFGTVVPVADENALTAALIQYMSQDVLREETAAAFKNHIEACYSSEAVISNFIQIYKTL